ncbi:Cytochrome c8 [Thiorhodovibrio winogradskyi]|uniref:Cytochrome c-551 n=1 Tax=Thiorhodovibrio winogradskyi TaxID=77007 RepID=A0ABZ0S9V8_9GAMM|nr:c-type cytochrome [Thiorhodovibrio winogradskyi]
MKTSVVRLHWILVGGLALAAGGPAQADLELAQQSGCTICHGVDQGIVGPSYKEVAAKYKSDPSVVATLVAKVKAGGAGNWGEVPMPPNSPQVSDENIRKLVEWVLSL